MRTLDAKFPKSSPKSPTLRSDKNHFWIRHCTCSAFGPCASSPMAASGSSDVALALALRTRRRPRALARARRRRSAVRPPGTAFRASARMCRWGTSQLPRVVLISGIGSLRRRPAGWAVGRRERKCPRVLGAGLLFCYGCFSTVDLHPMAEDVRSPSWAGGKRWHDGHSQPRPSLRPCWPARFCTVFRKFMRNSVKIYNEFLI